MSRGIYQVYIADGFADDCEELIDRCLKTETLTYHTFCELWKDMNFALVFQGRPSGAETAELSEELIHIAKHYMIANVSNIEESIAGLFLVYALLNLQPYPGFAALRLVPDDMQALKRIEAVARRDRRYDVLYILGAVLIRGPCQFHIEERQRGMEGSIRKYLEGSTSIDKQGVRAKGVFYRQNRELDIIRELEGLSRRYKIAKSLINETKPADPNLSYSNEKLPSELYTSLKKLINGMIDDDEEKNADQENHGNEESSADHYSNVQAIKSKAMKETVNPMKHLTGLSERKSNSPSPKKQTDIKTKAGKIKSGSPTKPLATSSQRKRSSAKSKTVSPRRKKVKRLESYDEKSPSANEELNDDLNVDEFVKGDNSKNQSKEPEENNTDGQEIDIDSLPPLMKTEDESIQIEIICEMDEDEQLESCQVKEAKVKNKLQTYAKKSPRNKKEELVDATENTVPNLTTTEESKANEETQETDDLSKNEIAQNIPDEDNVFKKPKNLKELKTNIKRNFKRPNIKSKVKRMGILPADFDESK